MEARVRTAHETELVAKAARYLAGGTLGNLLDDVILTSGRGSHVRDASGHEYIDYLLGSGPMLVGHAHPEVVAAVRDQLERGSTFFANNEPAILLAEEILQGDAVRREAALLQQRHRGDALRDAAGAGRPPP